MQTYKISLTATRSQQMIPTNGDLFVYESGTLTGPGAAHILVKPDNGNEIRLKPGQRFRLGDDARANSWLIRSADGTSVIDGFVVIGAGDFDDANTNNVVTLGEGFNNVVTVQNPANNRVLVALDPTATQQVSVPAGVKITNAGVAQSIPVTIGADSSISTSDPIMAYTNSKKVPFNSGQVTALITPAENVNGIIVEQMICTNACTVLAKTSLPGGQDDGDIIEWSMAAQATNRKRVKLAPGKGLYVYQVSSAATFYLLYTVL